MTEFAICIDNEGNPASLIVGKVYRRLPDPDAESHQILRIVDEDTSEADGYLYPASMFAPVELPELLRCERSEYPCRVGHWSLHRQGVVLTAMRTLSNRESVE